MRGADTLARASNQSECVRDPVQPMERGVFPMDVGEKAAPLGKGTDQ
jgi:hypothetical protein